MSTGRKEVFALAMEILAAQQVGDENQAEMGALDRLGPAIARLRLTRPTPVTRAELARMLEVRNSNINSLEAEGSLPSGRTLDRVLTALECDVHDLADALDFVNLRGRYSPEAKAAGNLVAEPTAGYAGQSVSEILTVMARQLERQAQEIDELKRRSPPAGTKS